MRRSSSETRTHVLQVARDLFYWHGIRATGVDTIAREAGVAPTTLYRLFSSKDDLVAAYLEREAASYRAWFTAATFDVPTDARGRLLSLFAALAQQVQAPHCRGCPFQMGLAELSDPALPGHARAVALKVWTREQIRSLTRELPALPSAADAELLADQLLLVMEGVYASVMSFGDTGPANRVLPLVEHLTDPEWWGPRTA